MHAWPIQDAKARSSECLNACLAEGPQMITKRGSETAVLVPVDRHYPGFRSAASRAACYTIR
jgi:prevent-host-death family protein